MLYRAWLGPLGVDRSVLEILVADSWSPGAEIQRIASAAGVYLAPGGK